MSPSEIYESLKGTRVKQGELTIADFTDSMYEDLYYTLLEELAEHIGGNYEFWYTRIARSYHKYKQRSHKTYDYPDPQYEKALDSQTIREQLATIKYYCQKRAYSRYPKKEVEE